MKLIIYMPALNEEDNIQQVINNLPRTLDGVDSIQYLVIDDGSIDNTEAIAVNSGAQVVRHGINRGVGAAFHSAVQFALENDADILVGMDADGQFNPVDIPAMIAPILSGKADMVMGNRFASGIPEHMPRAKYWGNQRVAELIHYVSKQKFQDVSCGFRAYSRETLFRLNIFAEFTYTHETILSLVFQGLQVMEYPIWIKYFPERKSRVAASISNYALQTSRIILRVMLDYRPLRIFGTIGGVCLFIGSGFITFLMIHFILTDTFTPYKNTGFIGLGFIVFGMLVSLIALIADMLNRVRINQDKMLYEFKKIRYKN